MYELNLHQAAKIGNFDQVKSALKSGCSVHDVDRSKQTVLHICAQEGHFELAKILVSKYKADINAKDKNGWSSLHAAASIGCFELVDFFLCQSNTNIAALTDDNSGALHYLARHAPPPNNRSLYEKVFHMLITGDGALDVNHKNRLGETPLHAASLKGKIEPVQLLMRYRALPNMPNAQGETPLHFAIRSNVPHVVAVLMAAGANPDCAGSAQGTPRQIAEHIGNRDVLNVLGQAGQPPPQMMMPPSGSIQFPPHSFGSINGLPPAAAAAMQGNGVLSPHHMSASQIMKVNGSKAYMKFLQSTRGKYQIEALAEKAEKGAYVTYAPNPRASFKGKPDNTPLVAKHPIGEVKQYMIHPAHRKHIGIRKVQAHTTSLAAINYNTAASMYMSMPSFGQAGSHIATPRPQQGGGAPPPFMHVQSMPMMQHPMAFPQQGVPFQPPAGNPPPQQQNPLSQSAPPDPQIYTAPPVDHQKEELEKVQRQREAEKEAREQAEKDARERAEKDAREQAEKDARERAEKDAREQAEKEAREARERAEKDAREQAEKEAQKESPPVLLTAPPSLPSPPPSSDSSSDSDSSSFDDDNFGGDALSTTVVLSKKDLDAAGISTSALPNGDSSSSSETDQSSSYFSSSGADSSGDDGDDGGVDSVEEEIAKFTRELNEMSRFLVFELDKQRVKTSRQISEALRKQAEPFLEKYGKRTDLPSAQSLVQSLHEILSRYDKEIEGGQERLGLWEYVGGDRKGALGDSSESSEYTSDYSSDYSSDGDDLNNFGMGMSVGDI